MNRAWNPGEVIVQEGWSPLGKLIEARPARVVEDSPRGLMLYFAAGSTYLTGDPMRGRQRYALSMAERLENFLSTEVLELEERVNRRNVLSFLPPQSMHAVWFFWDANWNRTEGFVNLQAPYTRKDHGIAVIDYWLDLAFDHDLTWRFKDEDEFEAMRQEAVIDETLAHQIRAEAAMVISRIESRQWPFDRPWPTWQPPEEWLAPKIRDYWGRDETSSAMSDA